MRMHHCPLSKLLINIISKVQDVRSLPLSPPKPPTRMCARLSMTLNDLSNVDVRAYYTDQKENWRKKKVERNTFSLFFLPFLALSLSFPFSLSLFFSFSIFLSLSTLTACFLYFIASPHISRTDLSLTRFYPDRVDRLQAVRAFWRQRLCQVNIIFFFLFWLIFYLSRLRPSRSASVFLSIRLSLSFSLSFSR